MTLSFLHPPLIFGFTMLTYMLKLTGHSKKNLGFPPIRTILFCYINVTLNARVSGYLDLKCVFRGTCYITKKGLYWYWKPYKKIQVLSDKSL